MKNLEFGRYALSYVAAATLAACGGSQPPIGAPGATPQTSALATHAERGTSWMLPEAASQDLLYVTNYSYTSVYSYPTLKLVGVLKDFKSTVGDCVDAKGDVFITNHLYSHHSTRIAEYAHGGTKPIAELANDDRIGPVGCSIDPVTGDLAVSGGGSSRGVGVNIFKRARGKPLFVKVAGMVFDQFCGYDDRGNLFVAGQKDWSGDPALAELSKGSQKFVDINLDATIDSSGGVQWDGKHLAIGAYVPNGSTYTPVIFRFSISGSQGTRVGTTTLGAPAYITSLQFFILNDTVIQPNWYYVDYIEKKNVLFYKYPQGGSPIATLTKSVTDPRGVVVSLAQK
jgi:hypothetical protein